MLKIRLTRIGKKKQPFYRIVVAEHTAPIQGKFVEMIGNYNPFSKKVVLDKNKAVDWMNKGAMPSNTVAKILQREGLKHKSIVIKTYKTKSKTEIEKEKQEKEAEKAKEQAEKEVKKAEFEKEVEEKKETEAQKAEETQKTEEKEEKLPKEENKSANISPKEENASNNPPAKTESVDAAK